MNYKVNLHITGTITIEDDEAKQVTMPLFTPESSSAEVTDPDKITDKQVYFLSHNTKMNANEIAALTKYKASEIISEVKAGTYVDPVQEVKKSATEQAATGKISALQYINKVGPLPWEEVKNAEACSFEGCNREATTKGLCHKHYQRKRNAEIKMRKGVNN